MSTNQELLEQVTIFNSKSHDLSGINWPDPKDILRKRLKLNGVTKESLDSISKNSPSYKAVDLEISFAKTSINSLIGQLPSLTNPITAPTAITTTNSLFSATLKILGNLEIEIPSSLLPILKAINKIS